MSRTSHRRRADGLHWGIKKYSMHYYPAQKYRHVLEICNQNRYRAHQRWPFPEWLWYVPASKRRKQTKKLMTFRGSWLACQLGNSLFPAAYCCATLSQASPGIVPDWERNCSSRLIANEALAFLFEKADRSVGCLPSPCDTIHFILISLLLQTEAV